MKKFFKRIYYWWFQKGKYLHRDIQKGFRNLWRWFPVIWNDRDWDDYFIWILLEKKLTNQANYIGGRDFHTRAKRDAEVMMTCVRLIKKIREEYYRMEYFDYQKSEYHWDDVPDRPDNKQLRIEEISDNLEDYFKKYPRIYKNTVKNLSIEERRRMSKRSIANKMSWENHHRARKLLFKLMEQHIEGWWE